MFRRALLALALLAAATPAAAQWRAATNQPTTTALGDWVAGRPLGILPPGRCENGACRLPSAGRRLPTAPVT